MARVRVTIQVENIHDVEKYKDNFEVLKIDGLEQGDSKYPNYIQVQITKKDIIETVSRQIGLGDLVSFDCFINGRKWEKNGKVSVFLNLTVASFNVENKNPIPSNGMPSQMDAEPPYAETNTEHLSKEDNELPF